MMMVMRGCVKGCGVHPGAKGSMARLHLLLLAIAGVSAAPKLQLDGCPNPIITKVLFGSLNLSFPGLLPVNAALKAGNSTAACNAVAGYYASSNRNMWLRQLAPLPGKSYVGGAVDAVMLNDTYTFYGEVGRVPRNADGGLEWHNYGPVHDDEVVCNNC